MSFFDEADEPRTASRPAPRRQRPSGRGRPPGDQQAVQTRRAVAAVAIVVFVVLIALGIHSCQVSARKNSLKDYANSVNSIMQSSVQTGQDLFRDLDNPNGSSNAANLQTQIDQTRTDAERQLKRAESLSVPDEVQSAQRNVVLSLQMRLDGVTTIGNQIQPALGTSTNKDALTRIAGANARFYASDVAYKDYAELEIVSALHAAGVPVGGASGQTIYGGQFVSDLGWLQPDFVATKLGAQVPTPNGKPAPGLHGHSLTSVAIAGTTLTTSGNNVPASPAPTFTLSITNGGDNNEHNVKCKVTVQGANDSGETVIPQTTAHQSTTCSVPLASAPSVGTHTVTATVEPVPGEKNSANNSLSFPVTFQ